MDHVFVTRVLTGHMYKNSIYETSNSCGNCDGACCEYCEEKWDAEDWDDSTTYKRFDTKDEAEAYAEALRTKVKGV